jgi:adenylate cyclase class 2
MYEVEQKFPVPDLAALEARFVELGARFGPPVEQVDAYFAHPSRDFASTDEALRIRRIGNRNLITYKGPKIDPHTKTRREIELPLGEGADNFAAWRSLLVALGFRPVADVQKRRRTAEIDWQGRSFEATLDDVTRVGTFCELETSADDSTLEAAKASLHSLAKQLQLTTPERRSYLEMLLLASGERPA